jgi:hypothetical protein
LRQAVYWVPQLQVVKTPSRGALAAGSFETPFWIGWSQAGTFAGAAAGAGGTAAVTAGAWGVAGLAGWATSARTERQNSRHRSRDTRENITDLLPKSLGAGAAPVSSIEEFKDGNRWLVFFNDKHAVSGKP